MKGVRQLPFVAHDPKDGLRARIADLLNRRLTDRGTDDWSWYVEAHGRRRGEARSHNSSGIVRETENSGPSRRGGNER